MFLRAKLTILAITERVSVGAVEIIEIIENYEEQLRLAKEEIELLRKTLTDVQRCEPQHSVHISACKKEILPVKLQEEESDSSDSQFTVYPISIASIQFEELTECQQTGRKEDNLSSCHEAEESGGSGEAHCSVSQIDVDLEREDEEPKSTPGQAAANIIVCQLVSPQLLAAQSQDSRDDQGGQQSNWHVCEKSKHTEEKRPQKFGGSGEAHCSFSRIDVDQMTEDEEPKSSPGQAEANMMMDYSEIQQEEEDKEEEEEELSSSSNIDKLSQNTQADTEDHTMSSTSSPSFKHLSIPLQHIQLMENSGGDCRPSSRAQQEETRGALNATEGCQLLSPQLLVAPSQDSRDDQGGQQSHQNQYNCLVCEKVFKHSVSMKRHMKKKHDKEKPRQKFGGSGEAHCSFSQMAIDQMTEDEEPKSSPGQAAANMMMDYSEIQQEEEDKEEELSSSSNIDKLSQNTRANTEDHTMSSTSSPSFKHLSIPLQRVQLMENRGGDCRPSSPAQQMKETREALNGTQGCQLLSPQLLVAPSQDTSSRDDQGGQQSHQNQYIWPFREKGFKHCKSVERHLKSKHSEVKPHQNHCNCNCHVGEKGLKHRRHMNRHMDCTWIDQMREEEDDDDDDDDDDEEELSSSSNIDKCSQDTQADAEDHTMSSTSNLAFKNLSIPLRRIQLMENRGGDCRPSDPEIQLEEEMASSSDIGKCQNTQADAEDHEMICEKGHMDSKHAEEKPHQNQYYCQVCGKGFQYHINLKRHVNSNHAGKTTHILFYCHVCGKGFAYQQSVKRHMKNHHTGDKPYRCQVCGKGFKCTSDLRRHMKSKRAHT